MDISKIKEAQENFSSIMSLIQTKKDKISGIISALNEQKEKLNNIQGHSDWWIDNQKKLLDEKIDRLKQSIDQWVESVSDAASKWLEDISGEINDLNKNIEESKDSIIGSDEFKNSINNLISKE